MTDNALDLGVFEAVDDDLVTETEQAKMRADRTRRAAFGATEEPPSEEHHEQENPAAKNHADPFYHVLPS